MSSMALPFDGAQREAAALRRTGTFASVENVFLAAVLLAMTLIPLAEIVLRRVWGLSISGSTAIVQHGTLLVSMIGAAIAAREDRLLSMASASFLTGRARSIANIVSTSFAATISIWLMIAGLKFVANERTGGAILVYGLPLWIVQAVIPAGFALIAARLLHRPSWSVAARTGSVVLVTALCSVTLLSPIPGNVIFYAALVLVVLSAVLGAPIFAILGGAALVLNWAAEIPLAAMPVSFYSLVVNPSLPTIPLFTLAGYVLAEGGSSRRLVGVFDALLVGRRGGAGIATALACAFFTTFTGGSGVTILALGGLLMPILLQARYSEKNALGLLTGAGALGLLFPPCLPLILYAIAAGVEMKQMFLGGLLPGVLLLVLTAWLGVRQQGAATEPRPFDAARARAALWSAKWELLLPPIVLVALFGGFATPVEVAALTAAYALFVTGVIHRDFSSPRILMKVFVDCGLLVGGILLIIGISLGLTGYLVDAEIPQLAVEWVTSTVGSRLLFLLLLNLVLIAVGAFMDIYSAIIVVVPLLVPLGVAYGIDPIHLGVIFLANLELGYLMPPVGENLFISSYRFNKPLREVYQACRPMILVYLAGVVIITWVPALTTFLPRLLMGGP